MLFVPRNIAGKLTTQGQRTPRELTRHDTQQELPTVFSTSPNIKSYKDTHQGGCEASDVEDFVLHRPGKDRRELKAGLRNKRKLRFAKGRGRGYRRGIIGGKSA